MSAISSHFLDVAARHPSRAALAFKIEASWQQWSYSQLAHRVGEITDWLSGLHLPPQCRVGVVTCRDPDTLAAVIAILAAGHSYVPLDPAFPQERIDQMIAGADVAVIARSQSAVALTHVEVAVHTLPTSEPATDRTPYPVQIGQEHPTGATEAYVMFTSGSTGVPKGVMVPHRAVVRLVIETDFAQLDCETRFLVAAPLSFDASTLEMWAPLLNGGCCVLHPAGAPVSAAALAATIAEQCVTHAWLTASVFNMIVDERADALAPLTYVLTGGEALSVGHVRKALAALPDTKMVNAYGPTENTTFTTCFTIPSDFDPEATSVPIGVPIAGTDVMVVDDELRPVADGEEGELLALGTGLALGYVGRAELTVARFVDVKSPDDRTVRAYRTGDRVRRDAAGVIEFLGRFDDQVKIEGHRIEPGEIEVALASAPGVRQARVVARRNQRGALRMVAYILSDDTTLQQTLKPWLAQQLPSFMVPHFFVVVDDFPTTINGKLALSELPDPFADQVSVSSSLIDGELAATVSACWREVLGHNPNSDVNFFDAGGTSLDATALHRKLEQAVAKTLPPTFVYEHTSVAAQAAALNQPSENTAARANRGHKRRAARRARRGAAR